MNTKTILELRSIAMYKGLHGYYKLNKADLVALLEQSAEEMPTPLPKASGKERRCALPVKIIPSPQEMNEFEKIEMKKSRPVVNNKLGELYDQLIDYIPKQLKRLRTRSFFRDEK